MGASTNHHKRRVSWYEGDTLRDREVNKDRYGALSESEGEFIERFLARVAGTKR